MTLLQRPEELHFIGNSLVAAPVRGQNLDLQIPSLDRREFELLVWSFDEFYILRLEFPDRLKSTSRRLIPCQ